MATHPVAYVVPQWELVQVVAYLVPQGELVVRPQVLQPGGLQPQALALQPQARAVAKLVV